MNEGFLWRKKLPHIARNIAGSNPRKFILKIYILEVIHKNHFWKKRNFKYGIRNEVKLIEISSWNEVNKIYFRTLTIGNLGKIHQYNSISWFLTSSEHILALLCVKKSSWKKSFMNLSYKMLSLCFLWGYSEGTFNNWYFQTEYLTFYAIALDVFL